MKDPVVIVGLGEMAGVFARGLLRTGHPVYPVTRQISMQEMAAELPKPGLVLVAVGEADLDATLAEIPAAWRDRLGLLQNELLPRDWQRHEIANPTVISVWFEKKKGQDFKVLIPSPAFGPQAQMLVEALQSLEIAAKTVATEADLCYELVLKNVYILTTNIAGLECGGTVEDLWHQHRELAEQVANDVMDLQEYLIGEKVDRDKLLKGFVEGIEGDLQHKCMGRSAPARLKRALALADQAGLDVATLRAIARAAEVA